MVEKKTVEKKAEKKVVATAGVYDILRRPIISEKAARLSEANALAFEVDASATKTDISRALQAIYGIKPVKINIVNVKGKAKTFRGRSKGVTRAVKKAYVTLAENQKIDVMASGK